MKTTEIKIPITISVYNKRTNKLIDCKKALTRSMAVKYANSFLAQGRLQKERYICRVTYSNKQKSWNEFEFSDILTFRKTIKCDLEKILLRDLLKCGMMDKKWAI
jgi:hypothetical protein